MLPCAVPHASEVFATFDYPGADYPGPNVLEQFAKQRCVANFAAYVGRPYETSSLALDYELPDQADWGNGIRHVVGCLLVDPDGHRRVGSVARDERVGHAPSKRGGRRSANAARPSRRSALAQAASKASPIPRGPRQVALGLVEAAA